MLIEIVCQSVADARATQDGGAHRIELCTALAGAGGLTPTPGLLDAVKAATTLPIMAMLRPRAGGFCYDADELAIMERDAHLLIEHEAEGLVLGVLQADGRIDVPIFRRFVEWAKAAGRETVIHRAFDITPEPFEALETLIDLGVTRILTSGQAKTSLEGADLIAELRARANGRIEILPGGGVRANNAREILAQTDCDQLHLAPLSSLTDPTSSRGAISYGAHNHIDRESVVAIVQALADSEPQ